MISCGRDEQMRLADVFREQFEQEEKRKQGEKEKEGSEVLTDEFMLSVWAKGVLPMLHREISKEMKQGKRTVWFWLENAFDEMGVYGEGWACRTSMETQHQLAYWLAKKLVSEGFEVRTSRDSCPADSLHGLPYPEMKIIIMY